MTYEYAPRFDIGPGVTQPAESNITFYAADPGTEVMRIDRHGVRVNPAFTVDEATQHVLDALSRHIQHTINHAVAAEREACAKVAERFEPDEKLDYVIYASAAIRARGRA